MQIELPKVLFVNRRVIEIANLMNTKLVPNEYCSLTNGCLNLSMERSRRLLHINDQVTTQAQEVTSCPRFSTKVSPSEIG
jgi:hypothetical protein